MLGAAIGDIAGSCFEFENHRNKDFEMFGDEHFFTDDTVMTMAIAKTLLEEGRNLRDLYAGSVKWMQEIGRHYPDSGYGSRFRSWIFSDHPVPYGSWGNGSAMRISAVSWAAESLRDCHDMSYAVTFPTHSHPEGIKGAGCAAVCGFLARTGHSKEEIRAYVNDHCYRLDFTIDGIRDSYRFNESCQGTVPQAIEAFLEADSFEDAIRTAVSVGGDSDTLAAITGGIAECFWGIPEDMRKKALTMLDGRLRKLALEFEEKYPPKVTD